jgi:4-hydroxysphinganine ceramide fatty acyl 2-hydroxylase
MSKKAEKLTQEQLFERAAAKIDMRAPLLWQIQLLNKDEYLAWVHSPFNYSEEPKVSRIFHSDFLEPFSKTVWYVIPMVWIPVVVWLWHWFLANPKRTPLEGGLCFAGGIFLWTLIEYSLHRFVFHLDDLIPGNALSLTAHFLLHGIHHKIPMDRYRLVMPPVLLAALASCMYMLFRSLLMPLLPWDIFHATFACGLFGYICYDLVHYSQHHVSVSRHSYFGKMKSYHMKHHFSGLHNLGYGITSKFWDYVFGTVLDENAAKAASFDNVSGIMTEDKSD